MPLPAPTKGTNMSANETKQSIDTRWRNLQQAFEGIPESRMSETGVCGEWSAKDLLGHIAFWDDMSVAALEAQAAGTPIGSVEYQALNDESAAERSGWSIDQARKEIEAAHERRLNALSKHPELATEVWGGSDAGGHYDEHAAQIQEWRRQQGI